MKDLIEKEWITLGLACYGNPGLRRLLAGQGPEADPAGFLRLPEARDIFAADFPERADIELARSKAAGVALITFGQNAYPSRLRSLPDPPPMLYVRGSLPAPGETAVAIVGSRRATLYGLRVASELGREAARAGLTVVSGMARGIDTAAHRGALEAGGRTLGVLGCGMDVIYPKENRRLYQEVAAQGALVSEFPFGAGPVPGHFPVRNRIIAALSDAVAVVEAARDSGSLITANFASETMSRPVGAVPGPITSPTSEGCNDLLYDGATPIRGIRDLLEMIPGGAIAMDAGPGPLFAREEPVEPELRRLLEALSPEQEQGPDELAGALGLASGTLLGHLLELELRGRVVRRPGGRFIRKS